MFLQVPQDPEHLPTGGAAERFLPRVKPQVGLQVVSQAEAFAALRAGVGSLPGVEPQVAPEALPQGEGLGARRARVGPLARVEALMPTQDLPSLEHLLADVADVAVPGVGDDLLEAPDAVSALGEAAEAMARVRTLMSTEVFGWRPA